MKKIITLMLIAALALTLFACGSKETIVKDTTDESVDTAAVRENFDKASDYIESVIDTKGMTSSVQDDDSSNLYKSWQYDKEADNADISMEVEIGGSTVIVGTTTIPELKALGFDVQLENDTIEANTEYGFSATKDGKFCNMSVDNSSNKAQKAEELPISSVNGASEDLGAASFVYKGLKVGSSLNDVINALGTPNSGISLSAGDSSTTFSLNYYSQDTEDDKTATDINLVIDMVYDAQNNTAAVSSFNLSRTNLPAADTE